jgi:uncharacterized repeat protein (TIGR02543 family)
MQDTSGITNYDTIVAAGEYSSEAKLVINNVEYNESLIMSLKTTRGVFEDDVLSIGNAYTGRIDATIRLQPNVTIPRAAEVKVYIRIFNATLTSGWLPKGVFYIYQRAVNSDGTAMSFIGFDGMYKGNQVYPSSALEWSGSSPTPRQVLNEIATILGVTLDLRTQNAIPLSSSYIINFPAQYTIREVLQSIAVIYMGNFCMSDTGELLFVGIANIIQPTPTPDRVVYTIEFDANASGVTGIVDRVSDSGNDSTASKTFNLSQVYDSDPQLSGYTFEKWNTQRDGSGTSYVNYVNQTIPYQVVVAPNTTVTLYAIWSEVSTSLLVDENGDALVFGSDRIIV